MSFQLCQNFVNFDFISITIWIYVPGTVGFRNFIVFSWAETLAHWNPTSCQKSIHNEFVRIWDSQIENSKIEIMETDRNVQDCGDASFIVQLAGVAENQACFWKRTMKRTS